MKPDTPSAALPNLPTAIAPPPTFGASPTGTKPKAKNTTSTFLGSQDVASPGNLAGKQLVGQ